MDGIDKELIANALKRVGQLEGVTPLNDKDLAVLQGHFDDYLLVYYMGQLITRGDLEILIKPECKAYFDTLIVGKK